MEKHGYEECAVSYNAYTKVLIKKATHTILFKHESETPKEKIYICMGGLWHKNKNMRHTVSASPQDETWYTNNTE